MTHFKVKGSPFVPGFINLMDKFLVDDYSSCGIQKSPSINIAENENAYVIEMMAPGLTKSDIKIAIEKSNLTISFEKQEEATENKTNYVRKEFGIHSFKKVFALNEHLNANDVTAKFENGILFVTIPKSEIPTTETKTVEVN
jgi:HSP20 family protein